MTSSDGISLRERTLKASAWSVAGFAIAQAIRFGSNLLMTRLLVPEMFGVMAIANMVIALLLMFSDVGLPQNVVQSKRGNEPRFLNTVWAIQIVRGVALWLVALIISALLLLANRKGMIPANSAYADPILPMVVAVVSTATIIAGGQSTKIYEAGRNLSLGRVTRNSIVAQVAGMLFMLGWAAIDRSIWALVAGYLCSSFVSTLLSHVSLPGVNNRWEWDRSTVREIIHFGKWLFLASILGFLATSGDRLLLAGWLSSTLLGLYAIAFLIFSAADQVINKLIMEVLFPVFSEVARERRANLKANYYRVHLVAASFAYFCGGALMMSGQAVIAILYDPRYQQAGWMLEVLAVALATAPFRVAGACLLALGSSKLTAQLIAFRVVTLFALTPLAFHYFGLTGALWAIVVSYFSGVPATIYHMVRHGLFDLSKELMVLPAWIAGMVLAKAALWLIGYG
jgi:O-antigen/teichoic acid export membrane protein